MKTNLNHANSFLPYSSHSAVKGEEIVLDDLFFVPLYLCASVPYALAQTTTIALTGLSLKERKL